MAALTAAPPAIDGRFVTLDGMRGIAAIGVMLLHAGPLSPLSVPGGYLAVDLFLVLSGFVIAHAYGSRMTELGVRGFMRVRAIRLYPLYFAGVLLGGIAMLIQVIVNGSPLAGGSLIAAILLLPSFGSPGYLYPINPPSWSLGFEVVVNWFYALLGGKAPAILAVGLLLGSANVIASNTLTAGHANLGAEWSNWWVGLARAIFSFTAGAALFHLFKRAGIVRKRNPVLAMLVFFGLVAALAWDGANRAVLDLVCIFAIFPALVFLGAAIEPFYPKLPEMIGDASYALYCVHYPLLLVGRGALAWAGIDASRAGPMLILAILVFAALLHWQFDVPARKWLRSKFKTAQTSSHVR